ncbi:hypothetical protein [Streptomyces sp. SM8]|uniref:hypothetical protein n=1 Tax=Streptomyces sp. SM8 TaxID=1195457 RepID=UPI00028310F6|nr:hypothetical protein [Streptomyces sp. SM8]PKA32836.1 hypothetical protein SM8_032225 [Streptomyces sp. SM8]
MPVGGNFTNCNCGPETSACESPTEPLATVGLCLADGSPIAVTVVRDCAGVVTSEGWLDLATGAWSAGPPPVGTVACGDSRSIQVSGTFCDIAPDSGDVLGLVLVEYSYAADGSIDGVRLVDAVTGETYTPTGTVTTCPAGVEQPERDLTQLCDINDDESGTVQAVPFLRDYQRDENGRITGHSDYTLAGEAYEPTGTVDVCHPAETEPCASTVSTLRLCDLNPDVAPDETGKRCAVPFLRHLVYDCTGALTEARDTATDGVTPYTPVEAVDCGTGGVPAMVEVPWEVVDIQPDPASAVGRGLIYTLSPIDDPTTTGTVTVTTSSSYNTASCPATPPAYAYRNPTQYTFTPDQALRDAASYVRCDLVDFDRFEPVTGLSPAPSRLGGTAYWDGTTVRPTANDGVGEMYYDGPPEQWTYRVGNTGGGNSCSSLSFAAVSLRPEGCCAPCGGSGGGDGSGRTVQEVCVIANAAPDDVMTWTRVIEDGGATIYYLDQDGARYDGTLPAGHQIVACPVEESDTCQHCETLTLCDVQPDESPGEPEIAYEAIPLAELGPAGSYGDGSPVTGTLPNGVGYSVNVGEWGPGQGHYTFYPYDGTQVWSFTEPVYVRFGLRGLNITPTECYVLPEGAVAESISPSHTWDPDSRYLCEITGQSSATDESVFRLGPVTELPIVPSGSNTGGRGPGLIEVGFPVDAPAPGSSTSFLRVVCRDCSGVVTSVTDTDLDGTPYTPSGTVTACTSSSGGGDQPAEPCRDSSTLLVCDLPTEGVDGTATASDVSAQAAEYPFDADPIRCVNPLPGGAASLWAGGAGNVVFPAETTASGTCDDRPRGQVLRGIAAELQADPPSCTDGTVDVTVSVRVTNDSPHAAAANYNGGLRLHRVDTGERLALSQSLLSTPANASRTLTATATGIDAGLLETGQLVVVLDVETFDGTNPAGNGNRWTADQFMATYAYGTEGCANQILRTVVTDCETGAVLSVSDTTMDGEPYEVTGDVGQCESTGGGATAPPEIRLDVETALLCIRDDAGNITGQVFVERIYADQTGERIAQRLTDPTTGDEVELPDGAELVACQEPACPVAFSTECVGAVTRTEAGYDNTSTINGVPGKCGSVQGPGGQFPCQPTGALTITSWIVDGEEVIGEGGGRSFNGGPCGQGTTANRGMHHNWALALTNLDPSGANWSAQEADGCAWFVGSTGGTRTVYGAMTVQDAAGQQWILGPAQACEEVQYTKVYTQECDGTVSVSWLDAQGVATDAPDGDLVPCGTGCGSGGGAGLDVETVALCDVQADGTTVPFLRHITYGTGGQVSVVLDTGLDAYSPYVPSGTVGVCQPREDGQDVELLAMCVIDNATGGTVQRILAEVRYDAETGERTGVSYVDPSTWGPVALPGGTHIGLCPEAEPEPAEECRNTSTLLLCDDTAGTPETEAVPLSTLAESPPAVSGTLPNGVGWSVSAGRWAEAAAGYSIAVNPGQTNPEGPQAWTFDQPVHVRVGMTGLNQEECAQLPPGLEVESLNTGHTWDPVTRRLCGLPGAPATAMTILRSTAPLTSLEWDAVYDGGAAPAASGVGLLELTTVPEPVQFLRHVTVDCETGAVVSVADSTLDGDPYTVVGEVGQCTNAAPAEPETPPCDAQSVLSACRWDDTDGDGIADTEYVELLAVDCDGVLAGIGTYLPDLSEPYEPVSPVDGSTADPGPEPAVNVQAHRVQLAPGGTWDAADVAALRSVTLTAHSGTGQITTADGVSTLFSGESVTWSVDKDVDAALVGPLTVTAGTGTVTVTWTRSV